MNMYRLVLDVTTVGPAPDLRVAIDVEGVSATDAARRVKYVSVSRDMSQVSTVGGLGYNQATYETKSLVRVVLMPEGEPDRPLNDCGRVLVVRGSREHAWAEHDKKYDVSPKPLTFSGADL